MDTACHNVDDTLISEIANGQGHMTRMAHTHLSVVSNFVGIRAHTLQQCILDLHAFRQKYRWHLDCASGYRNVRRQRMGLNARTRMACELVSHRLETDDDDDDYAALICSQTGACRDLVNYDFRGVSVLHSNSHRNWSWANCTAHDVDAFAIGLGWFLCSKNCCM